MEILFYIAIIVSFLYALALVSTLVYDLATGRYKRLRGLRSNMDKARAELEQRQSGSDKFWGSVQDENPNP